jgi:hypothetical protein
VREIRELQFKDGSTYAGQVLEQSTGAVPYGFGVMTTKEGFRVEGLFKDGKNQGEGLFVAPNGDRAYGQWNKNHRRHGKFVSIRASDGTVLVEEYDDGKMLKKVKRRPPAASTLHWLPPLSLPGTAEAHQFRGDVPTGHSGHSLTVSRDGGLVVLFGGERGSSGELSNDVYVLDVASRVWVKPATSGTVPPPMQGHTATLISHSRLVVIGGQMAGMAASSAVHVLDIERGVWSTPVAKGLSFLSHTATLVGASDIWVIVQAAVFVLNTASWEWREVQCENRYLPRQVPRSFLAHSAVGVGTMIYVFGGQFLGIAQGEGKKYERLSADLRILHTDKLSWEAPACTPPPAPAAAASAAGSAPVASDYSGFARGGWDTPRSEHTATLVGTTMYIIGGRTTLNPGMSVVDQSYLNDVQAIDVETLAWQAVPTPLPIFVAPRSLHAVAAFPARSELWCYGGRNAASPALQDWNVLHLPQAGAAAAAAAPAAKKAPAAAPAAAAKPAASASAVPAAAVAAAAPQRPAPASAAAAAPVAVAAAVDDDYDDDDMVSAGNGDIMAAFLKPA